MRHKVAGKKLGRTKNQRKALFRSLANNLILHEKIVTTSAKAKAVKPMVEKLVTRAKTDSIHNRRLLIKELASENTARKMLEVIGPKFKARPGGYTKIVKLGNRPGDQAPLVSLMFVEDVSLAVATSTPQKIEEGKVEKSTSRKTAIKKETKKVITGKAKKTVKK